MEDETIPDGMAPIAVRMAVEGVPVAAIARALLLPFMLIQDALKEAACSGTLVSLPKPDWPPGQSKENRLPTEYQAMLNDTALTGLCVRAFHLTPLQARVVSIMIRRPEATKEMVHQAIEHGRDPTKDKTSAKMVDVVICGLRRRLSREPYLLPIKTLRGIGYYMDAATRKRAINLLEEFRKPHS